MRLRYFSGSASRRVRMYMRAALRFFSSGVIVHLFQPFGLIV
jgi:hypothetical protein